jgi:hypothetical protein
MTAPPTEAKAPGSAGPVRERFPLGASVPRGLHSTLRESGSPIGLIFVYRALADLATEEPTHCSRRRAGACTVPRGAYHHHLICA